MWRRWQGSGPVSTAPQPEIEEGADRRGGPQQSVEQGRGEADRAEDGKNREASCADRERDDHKFERVRVSFVSLPLQDRGVEPLVRLI